MTLLEHRVCSYWLVVEPKTVKQAYHNLVEEHYDGKSYSIAISFWFFNHDWGDGHLLFIDNKYLLISISNIKQLITLFLIVLTLPVTPNFYSQMGTKNRTIFLPLTEIKCEIGLDK